MWDDYAARPDQVAPKEDWNIWLILGGRGSGKTRSGAEWVRRQTVFGGVQRVALVAPTLNDAREVMLEGDSGLLNIGPPSERPKYISSRRMLEWPGGAVGYVFSAEDPDSLRGPQFDCAWADEFCAWSHPEDTLSNLRMGLRLGDEPKLVMTTTPKPLPALKTLMATPGVVVTQSRTKDNAAHLSPGFVEALTATYGQSRLARQELGGEVMFDFEGALLSREILDKARVSSAPDLDLIIIAVDPPAASHKDADACGIIVAGRSGRGPEAKAYVLADLTVQGETPERWAAHIAKAAQDWDADIIVAETNQGGDMVRAVLNAAGVQVPIQPVFAKRSKKARAEPVSLHYTQGRIAHVGAFPELEDELCRLGTSALKGSPDRADALVWAATYLLMNCVAEPRFRQV